MACLKCGDDMELKISCLENTPFNLYLEPAELREVAMVFMRVSVGVGNELPQSPFYYLLSGKVEIWASQKTEGDAPLAPLTVRHAGAFFTWKAGLQQRKKGRRCNDA